MISGNYNNGQNNVPYGAVKNIVPNEIAEKLPEEVQNLEAKDIARQNEGVNILQNAKVKNAAVGIPIYLGYVGLRTINDTPKMPFSFAGEYEKTALGHLSKAGDTISNAADKIIPSSVKTGVPKAIDGAKNWILNHSGIARSLTTPIKFENDIAINQANGFFGRILREDGDALFNYGFKGGKDELVKIFKGDGNGTFWKKLVNEGIEKADDIKANEIVRKLLQEVGNMPYKGKEAQTISKELVEAFSKSDTVFEIKNWHIPTLFGPELKIPVGKIPVVGKFFTLKVPASEYANKIRVAAELSGNDLKTATGAAAVGTTALGRALPSVFGKVYEGMTSDFIGGKLAPIFQAFCMAQAGIKAYEAPKGKKLATFADESVGYASWMFTMPLATKVMARVAGLKYIGLGATSAEQVANVKKYRDMIQSLNGKIDAGVLTRAEYLDHVKEIKNFYKGNTKFWQKPLKFIGRILGSNMNGETIKPFLDNSLPTDAGKIKQFGMQMYNKARGMIYNLNTGKYMGVTPGGALRFALFMLVFSPLMSKPFKWVANKIFGKPYDPEEEKKEALKKAQTEAAQNNPFDKLSEKEILKLFSDNKELLSNVENNPNLLAEVQKNPQKLYEILQEGSKQKELAFKNAGPSQMLQNYINTQKTGTVPTSAVSQAPLAQSDLKQSNRMALGQINGQNPIASSNPAVQNGYPQNIAAPSNLAAQNQMQMPQNGQYGQNIGQSYNAFEKTKMPQPNIANAESKNAAKPSEVKRSYIPSSEPVKIEKKSEMTPEQAALLADIDSTIEKYNNIF